LGATVAALLGFDCGGSQSHPDVPPPKVMPDPAVEVREEQPRVDLVSAMTRVIELSKGGGVTPETVALAIGGEVLPADSSQSVEIRSPFAGTSVLVDRLASPGSPIFQVRFTMDPKTAPLMLHELSDRLDSYVVISESKTSSVRFNMDNASVNVFARLFTPTASPNAPIVRLTISGNGL